MWFCFNGRKKVEEILQRPDIGDEEFVHKIKLAGDTAKKTVKCCRKVLGEGHRLPPEKLYPNDKFIDIERLPTFGWDWDMMELVLSLEEALGIEIEEEQFPNWTSRGITLGDWIREFLSRCNLEC